MAAQSGRTDVRLVDQTEEVIGKALSCRHHLEAAVFQVLVLQLLERMIEK